MSYMITRWPLGGRVPEALCPPWPLRGGLEVRGAGASGMDAFC